jgi:adenosine deaminase
MKNFEKRYNDLPKVEIHCHLEGAIRTQTVLDIAQQYGLPLPAHEAAGLEKHIKVRQQLRDLASVLEAFTIARQSFVSAAVTERIARELFEDAARQNIRLFEVRFSPDWAFSGNQLDWDEALQALVRAQEAAQKQYGMAIGYIAITSRNLGPDSCARTVDWALRNREHIVGIDLADSEVDYPVRDFAAHVRRAKEAGMKVTIHTGEETSAAHVLETIELTSPDRIGHGIRIVDDPRAIEVVKQAGITLEVNPWSNYLTNSVRSIEAHPLKSLFDQGVRVTINSDDPEVLDTNLNNEYRIAHEVLGMSMDEIATCNQYALEASFLPGADIKQVRAAYFS